MTKLYAEIIDFSIELGENDEELAWLFRYGEVDDFHTTHEEFKERIHASERKPFPKKRWLWRVVASDKAERTLTDIFDNFHYCLDQARSQLRMFK